MFKNKLKYYLASEILKSYFFILLSLSLLIWIVQATKFLSLVTESGLSIKIYLNYTILLFPKIISQLMLISFMISLFLSVLKLQDNKEIEIYWLSGMSKMEVVFFILKISCIPTIIAMFFYLLLVPYTNLQSRNVLAKSEFSMINTLVKKNNFNSTLKDLTIFVKNNDNKGNLEKIFIFEENRTIIAKNGRVLNIKEKNYLELLEGLIHEKDSQNNIVTVRFDKTIFDFTKYQSNIVRTPKIQDRNTYVLYNELQKTNIEKEKLNYLYELNKRFFKPLFIPVISIICCFLLYANNEKINLTKLKIITFSISTVFIIFIEILLNLSIKNIILKYVFYLTPFAGIVILLIFLNFFFKKEPIYQ